MNFVHRQLREDLGQCLDAIYAGQPLEEYFEAMLRVQVRLQKWKGFSVQDLYDLLMDKAQQKMRALRKKIISDMKALGLVRMASIERVQSLDDYCLLTSSGYSGRTLLASGGSSSYLHSLHQNQRRAQANQLMRAGTNLLAEGARYEKTRRVSRYNLFWDQHDNKCTMLTFNSAPPEYQFVLNELKETYLSIRHGMTALEELWVFLLESVYGQVSHGFLIFED